LLEEDGRNVMLLADHFVFLFGVALHLDHNALKLVRVQDFVILQVHDHVVVEHIGASVFKKQVVAQVVQFADCVELRVKFQFVVILREEVDSSAN
jgi:hypothetical protein